MRTFDKSRRIFLTKENEIDLFCAELEYYTKNNKFPVTLFGKDIVNIYKNINLQIVISRVCNLKCGFCIENDGLIENNKEFDTSELLENLLSQYIKQGIFPNVSITGGEPTLFPDRLINILNVAKKHGIKRININTNGAGLDKIKNQEGFIINLSKHHYESTLIDKIFQKRTEFNFLPNKTVMQCVLMKGYIDSVNEIKKYINIFKDKAIGFSFRGLTELDGNKSYVKEVEFSKAFAVDPFDIFNQIANDLEFEFVQQKIGDHFLYEIYKYKGIPIRLTYSNFNWLRRIETNERLKNKWFSRATILLPNKSVYAGWTYDINKIYEEK